MDAKTKIDKQIELEHAASAVYKGLKKNATTEELRDLWHDLSVHEEYHAAALESLKETLSNEELEGEASALDEKTMDMMLSCADEFVEEASMGVSIKRSFQIAMFMEFSELNSIFFNAVKKQEEDKAPYIHSLGEGTKKHIRTLYKGIVKYVDEDEQALYLRKFQEYGLDKSL